MKILLTLSLMIFLVSCGEEKKEENNPTPSRQTDPVQDPSEDLLRALIDGDGWAFVAGRAIKRSQSDEKYVVELFDFEPADICAPFVFGDRTISAYSDLEVGETLLGNDNMATIFYADNGSSNNLIVTKGKIIIDEVLDDEILGRMIGEFDSNNKFNGSFDITFCD